MNINAALSHVDDATKPWCILAMQLQGVIPFNKKDYSRFHEKGRLRKADEFISSFTEWAARQHKPLTKQDVWKAYAPKIDKDFLSLLLGVSIKDGAVNVDGTEYIYNDKINNFAVFRKGERMPIKYDYALNFLTKKSGKKYTQILTAYYKWQDQCIEQRVIDALLKKKAPKEKEEITAKPIDTTKGKIDDLATFQPRVLRERAKYIFCYEKDEKGKYNRRTKEYKKHRPIELNGGNKKFALWEDMTPREKEIVDEMKKYIEKRGLHNAVNRPANGWAFNVKMQAIVNYARFALNGNTNATPHPRVSKLYRMVGENLPKDQRLRFVKGCYSIPYFLDQIKMRDKHMFVCEGCFDAAFIRNGVAICCWMPSADSRKIIKHYEEKHGFTTTYVTDNFRYGDKGGIRGLTHYADIDAYVFDWDLSDFFILPDTEEEQKINDINDLALFLDTNEIPRDFLLAHRKPAREVLKRLVEEWQYGNDNAVDELILKAKVTLQFIES